MSEHTLTNMDPRALRTIADQLAQIADEIDEGWLDYHSGGIIIAFKDSFDGRRKTGQQVQIKGDLILRTEGYTDE